MEVCCYNRNNCSRHSVIIMRVMNIQKAYKPKYQPFNRGGYIKYKRMYKTVDSIDIQCEIQPLSFEELSKASPGERSAAIRERVIKARQVQSRRFADVKGVHCNAQMTERLLQTYCKLSPQSSELLRSAMERLQLSARAYSRILKVARTIADLDGSADIQMPHIAEAVGYRNLDRASWAEKG